MEIRHVTEKDQFIPHPHCRHTAALVRDDFRRLVATFELHLARSSKDLHTRSSLRKALVPARRGLALSVALEALLKAAA